MMDLEAQRDLLIEVVGECGKIFRALEQVQDMEAQSADAAVFARLAIVCEGVVEQCQTK